MKTHWKKPCQICVGRSLSLLPAAFCLLLLGCGDGRVVVKGTVNVDGKPPSMGSINFASMDGKGPSTGGMIENGTYLLDGKSAVMPGKKRVSIIPVHKTGKRIPAGAPFPPGTMTDEVVNFPDLDEPNKDALLNVEVVPGKVNELNFNLKTKK